MDTNDQNPPNENDINRQFSQQFGNTNVTRDLPNATASLVLGIVSTVFGAIWCYWIGSLIAIVCGIIAIYMAGQGRRLMEGGEVFSQSSKNNNNGGKILGIIGLCLGILGFLIFIVVIIFYASVVGSLLGGVR
jgi:hypothetical protein